MPTNRCPNAVKCQACEGYNFEVQIANGDLTCVYRPEKVCLLNCHLGFVPTKSEIIPCQEKPKVPQNLTCEKPALLLIGGLSDQNIPLKSVEIYHPTISIPVTMPDLPQYFDESAALWFDGNLIICGEQYQESVKCYKFDKSEWHWKEDPEPYLYIRSGIVSFSRPKSSWLLYVTGGLSNNFGKSVIAYDYKGVISMNANAFHPPLYRHCLSSLNISNMMAIGKNHYYVSQEDFNHPWNASPHHLNLFSPSCVTYEGQTTLVLDSESTSQVHKVNHRSMDFTNVELEEPLAPGSQLTLLDGKVYGIGGSQVVKQIVVSENSVNVLNASMSLKQIRKNFAKVEVPLSYFS